MTVDLLIDFDDIVKATILFNKINKAIRKAPTEMQQYTIPFLAGAQVRLGQYDDADVPAASLLRRVWASAQGHLMVAGYLANFGYAEEAREVLVRSFSLKSRDSRRQDPWRLAEYYYQAGLILDQGLPGHVQSSVQVR